VPDPRRLQPWWCSPLLELQMSYIEWVNQFYSCKIWTDLSVQFRDWISKQMYLKTSAEVSISVKYFARCSVVSLLYLNLNSDSEYIHSDWHDKELRFKRKFACGGYNSLISLVFRTSCSCALS
jgi:hypothetical protein